MRWKVFTGYSGARRLWVGGGVRLPIGCFYWYTFLDTYWMVSAGIVLLLLVGELISGVWGGFVCFFSICCCHLLDSEEIW